MSTENKAAIRRLIKEVWNKGNLSLADELVATSHVAHDPAITHKSGLEGFKNYVTQVRTAFPDLQLNIDDIMDDGDKVIARWTARATHKADFLGVAPTGKEVTVTGITVSRFSRGKVVEEWANWDALGLMRQLGAVPASGETKAAGAG